jgi:hypothetical protein
MKGSSIEAHTSAAGTQSDKLSSVLRTIIGDKTKTSDIQKEIVIGHAHKVAMLSGQEYASAYEGYKSGALAKTDPELYAAMKTMEFYRDPYMAARKISKAAMDKGVITSAMEFGKFKDANDLLNKVSADPEQYLGKEQGALLTKNLAGVKDINERQNIAGRAYGKAKHLSITDSVAPFIAMQKDPELQREMLKRYQAGQDRMDQIWQLQKEGKIDTDAALNSDAVNNLGNYIENFGAYVDAFGTKTGAKPGTEQTQNKG